MTIPFRITQKICDGSDWLCRNGGFINCQSCLPIKKKGLSRKALLCKVFLI